MIQASQDFPWVAAGVSIIALLIGGWLFFRRPRKRRGNEPHCGKCDYLLIGISSERCPECGTVIDAKSLSYRERRARQFRRVLGSVLLAMGLGGASFQLWEWAASFYWYQYRPTFMVMDDLEYGSGKAAPMNDALIRGRGWLGPNGDLACSALAELQRRSQQGRLSAKYQQQIDELALERLSTPIVGNVQSDLTEQLLDRAISGKLSLKDDESFYQRLIEIELAVRKRIIVGDVVPICLRYQILMRGPDRCVTVTLKSLTIDGQASAFINEDDRVAKYHYLDERANEDHTIACSAIGKHLLAIVLELKFYPYGTASPAVHTELRALTDSFEVTTASGKHN